LTGGSLPTLVLELFADDFLAVAQSAKNVGGAKKIGWPKHLILDK